MDLTGNYDGTRLKVRAVAILKTKNGYLFEKDDNREYAFSLGGKIKANETSLEAVIREVEEEVGLKIDNAKFVGILENIFKGVDEDVHEVAFIYRVDIVFGEAIPKGFIEITENDFETIDIRPDVIKDFLNESEVIKHIVTKFGERKR